MQDDRWPDTYISVITQPYQFSSFNKDDPNSTKWPDPEKSTQDLHDWIPCYESACDVIENPTDFAKGANHYYAKYIDPPSWATEDTFVAEIGSHRFYRR